jgi:hypothetical protein
VVRAELKAAQDTYRKAQKEAAQVARELRKAERHEKAEEHKAAIKEKLDIH